MYVCTYIHTYVHIFFPFCKTVLPRVVNQLFSHLDANFFQPFDQSLKKNLKTELFGNQTIKECLKSTLVWISDTFCAQQLEKISYYLLKLYFLTLKFFKLD